MHLSRTTFPDLLRVRVERGLPEVIALAARQRRMTASELARRALRAGLEADGVELPALDRDEEGH